MKLDLRERLPRALNAARFVGEGFPLPQSATIRKAFDAASLVLFFYFVTQFFWPAPLGVIVQGAVVGGLTAMISFGMVLIYRANRIVNFAQGDMGGAPAALMVLLIASGWPYFVAVVLGLIAAVALGTIVESLIIRRFFKSPRLILTVATIGLSQILAGVAVSLPRAFDFQVPPQSFPSPFDFAFEIRPIIFRGNHILAMMAIAAAIVGLAGFFRYTSIGIAVRASAESADRAFLLGIPVKRVHTIVWVVAALLATVAMFLRAGIMGLPFGRVLAPAILLRALAAAVMGRMERLPTVFFAAISIGIIEQSIIWHNGNSNFTAPILFVVVLVGLLAQRKGEAKRTEEGSSWQALKEIRRIPRELKHLPEVKWVVRGFVVVVVAALATLPMWLSESRLNLMSAVVIYGIVGVSLVILTGWAGQVSLGQMAFVGIGAAIAGSITSRLHWDLLIAIPVAGLVGAATAVIIGLPALRMRGLFLAVSTLAFGLATSTYLLNRQYFGDVLPERRIARAAIFGKIAIDSEVRFYILCLVGLTIAVTSAYRLRWSRTGRVLIGVRDNERAVQAFSVNATRAKLTAFALSGFIAAFAGALFIHHQQSLDISPFEPEQSLLVFTMVVIGGLGSIPGALLGAFYIRGVSWFLPPGFRFFSSGIGVLVILMIMPGGLGWVAYQVRDTYLRLVARRRNVIVPSLVADMRQEPGAFNGSSLAPKKSEYGAASPDSTTALAEDILEESKTGR